MACWQIFVQVLLKCGQFVHFHIKNMDKHFTQDTHTGRDNNTDIPHKAIPSQPQPVFHGSRQVNHSRNGAGTESWRDELYIGHLSLHKDCRGHLRSPHYLFPFNQIWPWSMHAPSSLASERLFVWLILKVCFSFVRPQEIGLWDGMAMMRSWCS